ncbi:MAG: hypothetical protein IJ094_08385 [Bacilli bacterium]|nr:hypothetical protein [Bacilli bacterium]
MAKVYLDSEGLKSGCLIKLTDSINTINKVLAYFDYFDIPQDFSRRNELLNVEAEFRHVKKQLEFVKEWTINSNNNYNTLISNLKTQANKLPTFKVKQRNNIV